MLKPTVVLIVMVLCVLRNFTCFAQQPLNRYEWRWACFHPFAALRVKKHLPAALAVYEQQRRLAIPDAFNSGGKLDAFRHVYAMALLTAYVKPRKLMRLGLAHEKGNQRQFRRAQEEEGERPDSLACVMDLRNNELGFVIGKAWGKADPLALRDTVLKAIGEGKAWYLKRNGGARYVDCRGEALDLALYRHSWYVPKCLVRTNE